jgi:hypothetical protein
MRRAVGWLVLRALALPMAFAVAACSMAPSHKLVATRSDGKPARCTDAMWPTTSVNDRADHGDAISNVFAISYRSPAGLEAPVGYEYQTYGGREYFQPFLAPSANLGIITVTLGGRGHTPVVPFAGSFADDLRRLAATFGADAANLPSPYSDIASQGEAGVRRTPCYSQQELQRIVTLLSG